MMRRRGAALVAAAALSGILLAGCSGGGSPSPEGTGTGTAHGEEVRIAIYNDLPSWDPAQAGNAAQTEVMRGVYDTLLGVDADGQLIPWLAESWEYTDDANTVLELTLRDDVVFSDGTPFDADAAVLNLERFRDSNGPQATQLRSVSEIEAVDATTVRITLAQPDPALEFNLANQAGLQGSPAAIEAGTIGTDPVGTGPYVLDPSSTQGSQYNLTAIEDYWNPDVQMWEQITWRLLADPAAGLNALASKQIDVAQVNPPQIAQAEGRGAEVVQWSSAVQGLILLDREGESLEPLGDVRVRQAINYAFDRELLVEQDALGSGEVTNQMFGPETTAYVPEYDDFYEYDLDKAKQLMAEAGYADGFTVQLPWAPGNDIRAAFTKQSLAEIGITVETVSIPRQEFQASISSGDYPMPWSIISLGPTWTVSQRLLLPTSQYNAFGSTTPELTALLADTQDSGADEASSQALNSYLVENAWFSPWYRTQTPYAFDPAVVAVQPQALQNSPSVFGYVPAG